jgi:hypothetical protein
VKKNNIINVTIIGVIILFIGAVVIPSVSCQTEKSHNSLNNMKLLNRSWSDNFDSYTLDQYLDGTQDDGGWKGWDNDTSVGAYVVDDQVLSSPHSVEILENVDLVREFSGYNTGQWTFSAWQYIPNGYNGDSSFLLLNTYTDGGPHEPQHWSNAIEFSSATGSVESWDGSTLPIIFDEWIEIRVEINFDTDFQEIYYNDALLVGKSWTAGVEPGGVLNLACVDLYSGNMQSTEVYYDDLSLTEGFPAKPDLCCDGEIRWDSVPPETTVTANFTVENCGNSGTELSWEISDFPEWGSDWTFTPANGSGLTPEDGTINVEVLVVAPPDPNVEITGTIKVINSNNHNDFCRIDVYMKTPRNKAMNYQIFYKIFEKFPNVFPILQKLLRL